MTQIEIILYANIISADNPRYTEDAKQEVMRRYHERPGEWGYILEPIGEDREMYMKILGS